MIFIYKLSHPITNEIRYVGKTNNIKRRLQCHIDYSRTKKKCRPVSDWIKKLLSQQLKPLISVLEECDDSKWREREQYWIAKFRSQGLRILNLTDGGESNFGYVYTDELRDVRRKARLGKAVPKNVKEKIRQTLSKKVVCVTDEIEFKSIKEAVIYSKIPKTTFHRKLHTGELINGKKYSMV